MPAVSAPSGQRSSLAWRLRSSGAARAWARALLERIRAEFEGESPSRAALGGAIVYGMKINGVVDVPDSTIVELCERRHIRRMAIFGSALRGELRADSDLDVLVEFEPGHTPGLVFFEIEAELSALFGRKVDLNTPQFLSPRVRERVESEAEVLFAA